MSKGVFHWLGDADPSLEEMQALLKETDEVAEKLGRKLDTASLQYKALLALKAISEPANSATKQIDKSAWDKKDKDERGRLFVDISALKRSMTWLDFPDIRGGIITFAVLAVSLFLSVGLYLGLHAYLPPIPAAAQENRQTAAHHGATATPAKQQPAASAAAAAGQGGKQAPATATKPAAPPHATVDSANTDRVIKIEQLMAILRLELEAQPLPWETIKTNVTALSGQVTKDKVTFPTKKALGTLSGAAAQGNADAAKQALRDLDAAVTDDLADPPAHYLWTTGAMKWIEIGFWALFGVLVGLMYYVSRRLQQGLFDLEEVSTMAAEALAAPVVACVVFFLFSKTGITEVSLSGESMFVLLGFAFILGYAIRRTIGLLDNLKRRILPEP